MRREAAAAEQALASRLAALEQAQRDRFEQCTIDHAQWQANDRVISGFAAEILARAACAPENDPQNERLPMAICCRPPRPEDVEALALLQAQVRSQEVRAQAAEVSLHSLRKEVGLNCDLMRRRLQSTQGDARDVLKCLAARALNRRRLGGPVV